MRKIMLVIAREYLTRVRKKSFILLTLLAPVAFALFFVGVILLTMYAEGDKRIAVVDNSGYFKNRTADQEGKSRVYLKYVDEPVDSLKKNYAEEGYDGVMVIPEIRNLDNPPSFEYFSHRQLGMNTDSYLRSEFKRVLKDVKIEQGDVDEDFLRALDDIRVQIAAISLEDGEEAAQSGIAIVLGYIMGFIIYIVLFIYGTMVMKGVVEEKTNRIVEVIASSVKPFQLMIGKVIGIGAVGLTQFMIWGVAMLIIYTIIGITFGGELANMQGASPAGMQMEGAQQFDEEQMMAIMEGMESINFTNIFLLFLFYFFGGYLLYGSLFAAVGAATNDDGEGQSLNFIVSIPIIISIIIMTTIVQDPDSSLALWASIIPFTSPIVMMGRIPFEPPTWQLIVSMVTLVGGFIFTTWLAAKIYRIGILMYGKKITPKELGKWIIQR